MAKNIWVYIEQTEGKIANVSLELLGEAKRLQNKMKDPGKVEAILIGDTIQDLAPILIQYGAQTVYTAQDFLLKLYQPQYYATIIEKLIQENQPHILLIGATAIGSQLAPTIGAKIKTGVAAHCVELKLDANDQLIAVVPAFGGKVLGNILCPNHLPQMASIKPGILEKPPKIENTGEIVKVDISFLNGKSVNLKSLSLCKEEPQGVALEEADIVICGGWGVGDKEHWQMLEKIAERLGGAIACTRPPIDEGWAPGEHIMIGTSGKSIRPKVYIGFGISGATHHVCGMKDAGLIISINKDDKAEIFNVSDYGVVGDIKEILPLLSEALDL